MLPPPSCISTTIASDALVLQLPGERLGGLDLVPEAGHPPYPTGSTKSGVASRVMPDEPDPHTPEVLDRVGRQERPASPVANTFAGRYWKPAPR